MNWNGVGEEDGDVSGDRDGDGNGDKGYGDSWGNIEIDKKKCALEWKLCITASIGDADWIKLIN